MRSPCRARLMSLMISGRSIDAMYDVVEALTPGMISSVTQAPPTTSRRSSTRVFRPARAK